MLKEILKSVIGHFEMDDAKDRIRVIAENDRNTEGWFKAELMFLLQQEPGLEDWYPEVGHDTDAHSKKCDFVLRFYEEGHPKLLGIEVKTAFVGKQIKRTLDGISTEFEASWVGLTSYKQGIADDGKKLASMDVDYKMCLVFVYGKSSTIWRFYGKNDKKDICKEKIHESLQEIGIWNEYISEDIFKDSNPNDGEMVLHVIAYVEG